MTVTRFRYTPRSRPKGVVRLLAEYLPAFAPLGRCAESQQPGKVNQEFFKDDLKYRADPDAYNWPSTLRSAMALFCAPCPVRRECLAWAFSIEKRESQDWWSGEWEETDRRYGVMGGVPGRIREHFADAADPVAACDDWFMAYAERHHLAVADMIGEREETA